MFFAAISGSGPTTVAAVGRIRIPASSGDLFIAGIVPSVLIGIMLMGWSYIYSKKIREMGVQELFSWTNVFKTLNESKWAVFAPIIILGGIDGVYFMPTEAA